MTIREFYSALDARFPRSLSWEWDNDGISCAPDLNAPVKAILAAAPWVNVPGTRLILQPMTHAEKLREYLLASGYAIVGETLSREGERIYQTICAEPASGAPAVNLTPAELAVGQASFRLASPEQKAMYIALIDRTIRTETAARDARRRAGQRTPELDLLIVSLTALRNEL